MSLFSLPGSPTCRRSTDLRTDRPPTYLAARAAGRGGRSSEPGSEALKAPHTRCVCACVRARGARARAACVSVRVCVCACVLRCVLTCIFTVRTSKELAQVRGTSYLVTQHMHTHTHIYTHSSTTAHAYIRRADSSVPTPRTLQENTTRVPCIPYPLYMVRVLCTCTYATCVPRGRAPGFVNFHGAIDYLCGRVLFCGVYRTVSAYSTILYNAYLLLGMYICTLPRHRSRSHLSASRCTPTSTRYEYIVLVRTSTSTRYRYGYVVHSTASTFVHVYIVYICTMYLYIV